MASQPKYTVRICYDVKGWAYYRRACALQKYAPDDFFVTIGPDYGHAFRNRQHDLVLQLCYSYAKDIRQHIDTNGYDIILVTGYNVGFGYANRWFEECRRWSDHVIFNNFDCWNRLGRPPATSWISNGVDRELFPLTTPLLKREARVLWMGSKFHRHVKQYDELIVPLAKRLRDRGIPSDFRLVDSYAGQARLRTQAMANWYNAGTIYVVASKTEGTPNPALESASAGCVVVSTAVGNMPELIIPGVNGELVPGDLDAIEAAVLRCQERYVEMAGAMQSVIEGWHWKTRATEYFELFRKLIDERRAYCERSLGKPRDKPVWSCE